MFDPHLHGFFLNSVGGGSLLGIFLSSMLVSYVIPLPEVVVLLMIGFVARRTGLDLPTVIAISVAGTIAGDSILYRLSFFGNKYVQRFNAKMRANKLIMYEKLVLTNLGKTIFFLRFVTGVRFFGPVISGTLGAKWNNFIFYNSLATILHGTAFILLGFYTHHRIVAVITEVEIVRNILLLFSVVIAGFLIRIFSSKK
jgi:membrane protein DedA with SNARE-associated domain